jgi:hypothetical protein
MIEAIKSKEMVIGSNNASDYLKGWSISQKLFPQIQP